MLHPLHICVHRHLPWSHWLLQVSRQEAEKLAGAYGMRYVETSARDAINVEHAFTELTRDIFALVRSGDITIQEGWEGVKSGFVPNVVHSSEEVTKSDRRCLCWSGGSREKEGKEDSERTGCRPSVDLSYTERRRGCWRLVEGDILHLELNWMVEDLHPFLGEEQSQ